MNSNQPKEKISKLYDRLFGWNGLVLSSVFILVGITLEHEFNCEVTKILGPFLRELGIAIIILVGIGLTIERRHRKDFEDEIRLQIDEFSKNAFRALFNWEVPVEYLHEIEGQILSKGFVRERAEITYTLTEIPEKIKNQIDKTCSLDDRLLVDLNFKCVLRNMRPFSQAFDWNCFIEREDAPEFNRVYELTIKRADDIIHLKDEDLRKLKQPNSATQQVNNWYQLSGIKIPANGAAQIEFRFWAIRSKRHTREVFSSLAPTKDLILRVRSYVAGLDILAESFSPHDLVEHPTQDGFGICEGGEKCWSLDRPLLPSQGVMVWWHQKNP